MKNITMAIVGLGLLVVGSVQAATVGNFGPYAKVNSNEAASTGVQVAVSAEGRLNAYTPAADLGHDHVTTATSSEGHLNGYGS
ncbi:MAG: hypothetical protein COC05_06345 [Gammaproteobacteria bacterium]|nr:hypothetical protein [Beggiatoa alba]PCH59699.1 MAG: hypothetical protein COC05_06345 [Gammaproteobacteria bacterium]